MSGFKLKSIWIDCDPGHDDAFALLLAAHSNKLNILGISIVHGNDRVENCGKNAIRFLWASGIKNIPIYLGANSPLMRESKFCPEIHGFNGEDGVAGMCGYKFPDKQIFSKYKMETGNGILKMYERIKAHNEKVTVVNIGAQTNTALLIKTFPEIKEKIKEIVFMGGAIGLGNTGIAAEFNIEIDPEAANIVFHSGIPLIMIPLEVTHSNLVTNEILDQIKSIQKWIPPSKAEILKFSDSEKLHPHLEYKDIFTRIQNFHCQNQKLEEKNEKINEDSLEINTEFKKCCIKLLTFFKESYLNVFSFKHPPLHDPCAIFYLISPESFKSIDLYVDVETSSEKSAGRTLCDIHRILKKKPNVKVCTKMNYASFWNEMFKCLQIANKISPLNSRKIANKICPLNSCEI